MKILLRYHETLKELQFDNIVAFYGNISHQDTLYDAVVRGLNGLDKDFLLDQQVVKKKALNIIEFQNDSIMDDLKLTSKSYNMRNLIEVAEMVDFYELKNVMNEMLSKYESAVKNYYKELSDIYSESLVPSIQLNDLTSFFKSTFTLVDKEKVNVSQEVEFQLMLILNYVKKDANTEYFLLINHFDQLLDMSQMRFIMKYLSDIKNLKVFVFLKSFDFYECFKSQFPNYIVDDSLLKLESICYVEKHLDYEQLLTDEEVRKIKDVLFYQERRSKFFEKVQERHDLL